MKIKFFCPGWGAENIPWDTFCSMVKEAGFDGVETPIPFDTIERQIITNALGEHGLLLIGQYYQSFEKDLSLHKESFKKHLESMAALRPL